MSSPGFRAPGRPCSCFSGKIASGYLCVCVREGGEYTLLQQMQGLHVYSPCPDLCDGGQITAWSLDDNVYVHLSLLVRACMLSLSNSSPGWYRPRPNKGP